MIAKYRWFTMFDKKPDAKYGQISKYPTQIEMMADVTNFITACGPQKLISLNCFGDTIHNILVWYWE